MLSPLERDDGVTLIEVVVSMAVMAVFLGVFTTAITQIFGTLGHTQSVTGTQLTLNTVYERLDAEIRYASAISTPGTDGDGMGQDVEFLNTNGTTRVCTQLRLESGALQQRSWTQGTTPGTVWGTLATGVSATTPFTLSGSATSAEQVQVQLTAQDGSATQTSAFLFTAVNSTVSDADATVCGEGR